MLTRCPQCETIFKVSKKHISAAKGLVRCGSCKEIFNAKEHVIKSKKDLKKSIEESKSVISKTEKTKVASSQTVAKKESNKIKATTSTNDEAESFDFINDGFTSTISREKFEFSTPPTKKSSPKTDAIKRKNSTGVNFDSVFESDLSSASSEDFFTIKKPETSTPSKADKSTLTLQPITFTAKSAQPHKATVIQPAKPTNQDSNDKTNNFLSQNVVDIKNAFSSISRKISSKVSKKIQEPKQSDESLKKSIGEKLNEPKFTNSAIDTTIGGEKISTSPQNNKNQLNKPAAMSLDSDTKIFASSDNNLTKSIQPNELLNKSGIDVEEITIETPYQKPSASKIKPQLKEDAALKLAIQLKKTALEKTEVKKVENKTASTTDTDKKNSTTVTDKQKPLIASPSSKTEEKVTVIASKDNKKSETINTKSTKALSTDSDSKPKLQLVESGTLKTPKSKKTDTPASEEKIEISNEKSKETKDSKLIAKEEPKPESEEDENLGDGSFHIHMQSVDIPMVLRESLEELDLPTRSFEMTLFMVVSLIFLSLGIALQFAVFRSIEVQQDYPKLKPIVSKICETFNCDYNGPRDIKKVQLISRDIRVHPNTKGALLISATIINNANYQQPYPNFSVRLSNLSGKTIALRYFSPDDYLGKLSNELLLMPPNQPIRVSLEVVDPGKEAINFEFKFLSRN